MTKLNENFSVRKNAEILFNKRVSLNENYNYDSQNPTLSTSQSNPAQLNIHPSAQGYTNPQTGITNYSQYNRQVPTTSYKKTSTSTTLPSPNDPEYSEKMREINERLYKKRNDAIIKFKKTIMDAKSKYLNDMKEVSDRNEDIRKQQAYGDESPAINTSDKPTEVKPGF